MVDVIKRHDWAFPVGIVSRDSTHMMSLEYAKKLRIKLDDAIEWAVNMEDIRKERTKK